MDLSIERYMQPRALWWAFDWENAANRAKNLSQPQHPPKQQADANATNGCVVLIDEIDKAEADVPNGLLEALGEQSFTPSGLDSVVAKPPAPLVIITTNEERRLPDAFLRRCLVLHLQLPDAREALMQHLIARAQVHFRHAPEGVLSRAAAMLADDRQAAKDAGWFPLPGQAEFLDLLRAAIALDGQQGKSTMEWLVELADYTLLKNPQAQEQTKPNRHAMPAEADDQ